MNKDLNKGCELCCLPEDRSTSHIEKVKQDASESKANTLHWDCSPVCLSCKTLLTDHGILLHQKASYRLSQPTLRH